MPHPTFSRLHQQQTSARRPALNHATHGSYTGLTIDRNCKPQTTAAQAVPAARFSMPCCAMIAPATGTVQYMHTCTHVLGTHCRPEFKPRSLHAEGGGSSNRPICESTTKQAPSNETKQSQPVSSVWGNQSIPAKTSVYAIRLFTTPKKVLPKITKVATKLLRLCSQSDANT